MLKISQARLEEKNKSANQRKYLFPYSYFGCFSLAEHYIVSALNLFFLDTLWLVKTPYCIWLDRVCGSLKNLKIWSQLMIGRHPAGFAKTKQKNNQNKKRPILLPKWPHHHTGFNCKCKRSIRVSIIWNFEAYDPIIKVDGNCLPDSLPARPFGGMRVEGHRPPITYLPLPPPLLPNPP